MNYSIQKLVDDFVGRLSIDDWKMVESVPSGAAFNYLFFLYKEIYGDYPTGELYKILEDKFTTKQEAA